MPFEDQIIRLVEQHPYGLYGAAFVFVSVLVVWGILRTGPVSRLPVAQRRKVKEDVVRLMRGEYRGLTCTGIASKVGVAERDLRPLLADLIEDRFLLTEGDAADPIFRLRGLDNF
ncbi:MAG: hypothetical protein ACYDCL_07195 [Myxococcales bacterium]